MTTDENGPQVLESPRDRGNLAAGEASPIVEQVRRRREAAGRCEPLDCGHRDPLDCTAAGCGQDDRTTDPVTAPEVEPGEFAALWANAKTAWLDRDFPKYGSPEWVALDPDDPRRLAGALEAAEMWRKYGDEEELITWLKQLGRTPNLVGHRSRAELDRLAKPQPPHQLQATPGWPPIRVPGQPGRYLTHRDTHQEAA
ncbi:hypothetical protein ABZX30_28765 [Streptomyces sp. NPDC004542]|uniref:hypothetical protein n=1 Tax=Streptomyces sp. NPDC004542 TaxID=3154281 RepID=UPI0033A4D6B8